MTTPEFIVLDLDGTLAALDVDWPQVRNALATELAARGLPFPGGAAATLSALEAAGERAARIACGEIVARAERHAAAASPINLALLRWLQAEVASARLGVLTLNDRQAAVTVVDRLALEPRLDRADVLGRDEAPPKPATAGLELLLRRRGVAPGDALMVGDSEADFRCAHAAGVPAIDVAQIGTEWAINPDPAPTYELPG